MTANVKKILKARLYHQSFELSKGVASRRKEWFLTYRLPRNWHEFYVHDALRSILKSAQNRWIWPRDDAFYAIFSSILWSNRGWSLKKSACDGISFPNKDYLVNVTIYKPQFWNLRQARTVFTEFQVRNSRSRNSKVTAKNRRHFLSYLYELTKFMITL